MSTVWKQRVNSEQLPDNRFICQTCQEVHYGSGSKCFPCRVQAGMNMAIDTFEGEGAHKTSNRYGGRPKALHVAPEWGDRFLQPDKSRD